MADDYSYGDQAEGAERFLSNRDHGRRGRGGRSVGGGPGQGREVEISKALSKLLRHDALKEGLELDPEGFARLDQVLNWRRLVILKATFADIQTAVTDNDKQRFALKPMASATTSTNDTDPSHWLIRANQGHSIALSSDALLTPITLADSNLPATVVHGTYYALYPAIIASGGLKPMTRTHVHFGTGLPEDAGGVVSGMRGDAELVIFVDVRKSLEDGAMRWWMSENGVVLTEGDERGLVPTRYWKLVRGRRGQEVGVLWEDGVEVAELPAGVKGRRAPMGKGPKGWGRRGELRRGGMGGGMGRDRWRGEEVGGVKGIKGLDATGAEEGLGIENEMEN